MKCLSLWQPWATLLVSGAKHVETRGWPIQYRGPLLIHAAKKWSGELADICISKPFRDALQEFGVPPQRHSWTTADLAAKRQGWGMPFGAIIGRVDVMDCIATKFVVAQGVWAPVVKNGNLVICETERLFGDYSPGRFAFLCSNQMRFDEPIPYRGMQGLFEVPGEVLR